MDWEDLPIGQKVKLLKTGMESLAANMDQLFRYVQSIDITLAALIERASQAPGSVPLPKIDQD